MMQIIPQTDDQKMVMYMKCTKKDLIKMLIQCNKIIDSRGPTLVTQSEPKFTTTDALTGLFNIFEAPKLKKKNKKKKKK